MIIHTASGGNSVTVNYYLPETTISYGHGFEVIVVKTLDPNFLYRLKLQQSTLCVRQTPTHTDPASICARQHVGTLLHPDTPSDPVVP